MLNARGPQPDREPAESDSYLDSTHGDPLSPPPSPNHEYEELDLSAGAWGRRILAHLGRGIEIKDSGFDNIEIWRNQMLLDYNQKVCRVVRASLVIHYGGLFDLISLVQQAGRGGREEQPSLSLLLLNESTEVDGANTLHPDHAHALRQYVETNQCRRTVLTAYLDGTWIPSCQARIVNATIVLHRSQRRASITGTSVQSSQQRPRTKHRRPPTLGQPGSLPKPRSTRWNFLSGQPPHWARPSLLQKPLAYISPLPAFPEPLSPPQPRSPLPLA